MDWLERAYQCRATESEIRQWLATHGYEPESADFQELELHASQSTGQMKVFRFSVTARLSADSRLSSSDASDHRLQHARSSAIQHGSGPERLGAHNTPSLNQGNSLVSIANPSTRMYCSPLLSLSPARMALKASPVNEGSRQLYGACRDEQMHRSEIAIYSDKGSRDALLEQWSEGLTRRKKGSPCRTHCAMDLVWFAGALLGVMIVLAFLLQK